MSIIRPFSAVRYTTRTGQRDISARLSPPYDVLGESDKRSLLAGDARNFVEIDLPHVPPKTAGPPEAYKTASNTLRGWLADGTMACDDTPMLYVYHQKFRHADREYVRKMFFARLRLEPFGTGGVFPHERTFGGPKEDRLALTKATKANLSPIFGLYEDANNEVSRLLEANLPVEPLATGTLDNVENKLWGIGDPKAVAAAEKLLRPKPIYIADGHHRYGTALLYRDWLAGELGSLADSHPANFVLCVFCAMEDPGLLIFPTHRVLAGLTGVGDLLRADEHVVVTPLETSDPDEAVRELAKHGPQAVGLYEAATDQYVAARPQSADILDDLERDHSPAWRRLGLAFLHAYLLQRLVSPRLCAGKEPAVQYVKSAREALAAARDSGGCTFLLQPTTMEEMRGVCGAGDLMPQKSTYFYPKLASGLVINPLE